MAGTSIMEGQSELSEEEERKAVLAELFAVRCYSGGDTDELTTEAQDEFSEAEFSDLVFSIGWFIGMQHVGRVMHWDNECPVAPMGQTHRERRGFLNFSLWLWPYDRWGGIEAMGDAARHAEEIGFASVSLSDHTICTTGPESAGVTGVWPDWSVLEHVSRAPNHADTSDRHRGDPIPAAAVHREADRDARCRVARAFHAGGCLRLAATGVRDARRRLREPRGDHGRIPPRHEDLMDSRTNRRSREATCRSPIWCSSQSAFRCHTSRSGLPVEARPAHHSPVARTRRWMDADGRWA